MGSFSYNNTLYELCIRIRPISTYIMYNTYLCYSNIAILSCMYISNNRNPGFNFAGFRKRVVLLRGFMSYYYKKSK